MSVATNMDGYTNLNTLRLLDRSSAVSRSSFSGCGSIRSLKNVGRRRKLYVRAGGGARTSDTLCGRGGDKEISIVH